MSSKGSTRGGSFWLGALLVGALMFANCGPMVTPAAAATPPPDNLGIPFQAILDKLDQLLAALSQKNPKQPFAITASAGGNAESVVLTTVPVGKRLVVETITVVESFNLGGSAPQPILFITTNGSLWAHRVGVHPIGQDATSSFWSATHAVRFYADPSTQISLVCGGNAVVNSLCVVSLSGHFVDAP